LSKIKEELIGYEYEPSEWIEPVYANMVNELIEYQVYSMPLSELMARVTKQMTDEYYNNSYENMSTKYKEVFK
jgi:hypothetical protein|tara:strand:+ start:113 stop:331 length:219 start_codon:yes stop_codon:yes gene_type:complete